MSVWKSFPYYAETMSLVVVLLLHHHLPTCDAITNNQTHCKPSSCGKISYIKYPFRLTDDPTTCGDPSYELSCENNRTALTLFSGKYYVQEINYITYTIRLVDPGIEESDCSSIPQNFLSNGNFTTRSSEEWGPYEMHYPIKYENIIYLNCSKAVKDDAGYVDTAPCINRDSKTYLYVFAATDNWDVENDPSNTFSVGRLKDYCRVKVVALSSAGFPNNMVREDVPKRPLSSYKQIHGMLLHGFEVSWKPSPCKDTCGYQVTCNFDPFTGVFDCQNPSNGCHYPFGTDVNCTNISKQLVLVEDILLGIAKGVLQIFGITKNSSSNPENIDSKISIELGRVTGRYILPFLAPRFVLGVIIFSILLVYTYRKSHISIYENIEVFLRRSTLMPIRYSYKEIKNMTRNFKDKLGEGGFGAVYKGKLRSGPFAAIKMLGKSKGNGQDFINEVATIGRIHHTNVVRLIGFCVERSKRALVYEFMPNGSLDKYISSTENVITLTYKQMFDISLGVARGIAYLHQGCDMQILHFDIKPHNILLDENFIPKVSDFGLAKLYPNDISIVTLTAARGTIGYMAPELFYQNIGGVSYKADVYSFGMLLMEMASKRRNLNPHAEHSSQLFFPFWVYNQLVEEKDIEMDEITNEEMINVKKMFITALWCIQLKPSDRPPMDKVIEMLEGNIDNIEIPPKPSLYPNEMIQKDLEVTSDEFESNAVTD
ncbi:unnamed protein product [Lathyrus sativus]|nr:unnamed protein product [Lathyrus sativus]